MSIQNRQKMFIHHYKRAAQLDDPTYRQLLKTQAGVISAADVRFNQEGFDRVMAALETILVMRIDQGTVATPIPADRYIRSLVYWRGRLPQHGYLNSRQSHCIQQLWGQIKPYLNPSQQTTEYLCRIVHKATGKQNCGYEGLTAGQAACLINALRDRLAHAIAHGMPAPDLFEAHQPSTREHELVTF